MSATSLDRRNLVSEMLRRVPEAWVAFSEEESNWMSDPIDFDRFGPHMLIGLLETVLCTRLLAVRCLVRSQPHRRPFTRDCDSNS